jgi:hypothetical protein
VGVLFKDHTTVALGSNTTLSLQTIVPEGANPEFNAHVVQGIARFITGKIVEKNPKGFAVSTPEGTIGIRGTIFVVQVFDGKTTVFVINTTRQVYVNNILVPSHHKITIPDGSPLPMTPEDMGLVSDTTIARQAADDDGENVLLAGAVQNAIFDPATFTEPELSTNLAADTIKATGNAHVTGSLVSTMYWAAPTPPSGTFSFNVNLGSGAITNVSMETFGQVGSGSTGSTAPYLDTGFNLINGSGTVSGNSFTASSFTGGDLGGAYSTSPTVFRGMVASGSAGIPYAWPASLSGSISQGGGNVIVNGSYNIEFSGGSIFDNGTATGQGPITP